ncbi:MAG: ENTH domain-containing protein [Asgard group archaeon]|nr:ENTH domain-containing protein [Asgard group archaeon]
MPFIQSLKNLTSSTESKIRTATNQDPLGPYNSELTELARLTFSKKHLSIIISVINKRLKPVLQSHTNSASIKRSNSSVAPHGTHYSTPRRSNTISGALRSPSQKQVLDDKTYLSLLKTLTVILYILQNGSVQFIDWLLKDYPRIISPLLEMPYPSKYKDSIRHKIHKIISLLEVPENLNNYRVNIHKLRSDMLVPGLKRTSLDGVDLLQVEQEFEPAQLISSPRIRPTTPPILRLKSIHEHHNDESGDQDSNYTLTSQSSSPSFAASTIPINHKQTNASTVSNPHQLSPIF